MLNISQTATTTKNVYNYDKCRNSNGFRKLDRKYFQTRKPKQPWHLPTHIRMRSYTDVLIKTRHSKGVQNS